MVIHQAKDLQDKFQAGLSICGVEDGQLQWIGTKKQWEDSDHDCTLSEEDGCIGCEKIADRVVHNDDCPLFSDNSGATEGVER